MVARGGGLARAETAEESKFGGGVATWGRAHRGKSALLVASGPPTCPPRPAAPVVRLCLDVRVPRGRRRLRRAGCRYGMCGMRLRCCTLPAACRPACDVHWTARVRDDGARATCEPRRGWRAAAAGAAEHGGAALRGAHVLWIRRGRRRRRPQRAHAELRPRRRRARRVTRRLLMRVPGERHGARGAQAANRDG